MDDEQQAGATRVVTDRTGGDVAMTGAPDRATLERQLLEARQAALVSRDHVVGIEAEIGRQNAEILRLNAEVRRLSSRDKRLTERKRAQAKRISALQAKLDQTRKRNAALTRRVRELEASASAPSFTRRVVRRLRRAGR